MKANPALRPLDGAVGRWVVTGSHPYMPDRALRGEVTFERIEGGAFIRMHSKMEDAQFPEGVAIFGTDSDDQTCTMLYFDERGIGRRYDVTFHDDGFSWSRDTPKFAQRFGSPSRATAQRCTGRERCVRKVPTGNPTSNSTTATSGEPLSRGMKR